MQTKCIENVETMAMLDWKILCSLVFVDLFLIKNQNIEELW